MKGLVLSILVLLCICNNGQSQSIKNVSAQQAGNMISISYDLLGFKDVSYLVDVFCSTDNGQTFPIRITSAKGDIGNNITMGNSKKLTWDVLKDVNSINSNETVFKVVAHPTKASTNIVLTLDNVSMTISKIYKVNNSIQFDFVVNSKIDEDVFIDLRPTKVYLYSGDCYDPKISVMFGDRKGSYSNVSNFVPQGVPVKGHFTLSEIPSDIDKIARLDFKLEQEVIQLKDILIEHN